MAEGVGFEPTVRLPVRLISSQLPTALAPLETKATVDLTHQSLHTGQVPDKKKKPSGWAHNAFEPTAVPCLYRRRGKRGDVYYGRVKRHGRIYLTMLSDDFEMAKRALRKWLGDTESKAATAAAQPDGKALSTWGHFKDRWLRGTDLELTLAPRTKEYRHASIARIIKVWGTAFNDSLEERKITAITQEQCQTWAHFAAGYAVQTYNNMLGALRAVFQEALDTGHLLVSPARKLKRLGKSMPRVHGAIIGEPGEPLTKAEQQDLAFPDTEEERWYPSPEEFRSVVAQMRSYQFGPCQAASEFAELLCYTGCRLSEANRLRWSDVDWKSNRLRVNGAKGRAVSTESSIRFVPISKRLADLLKRMEKLPKAEMDRVARVKECRGTMQRACVDLKLPRKLDHHDLRHTFATWYVTRGMPVPLVADLLGHKDGGALLLKVYRHKDESISQKWIKSVRL